MRHIFLKSLLISGTVLLATQQSNADQRINNIPPPMPIWGMNQTPIAWGDCVPVPVTSIPFLQNNISMGPPKQAMFPSMPAQPMILPPPSPFFNTGQNIAPIPMPMPNKQVVCDDSSKNELASLQMRYNQASAASRTKLTEISQALADANNQMADARVIIDNLSKEKNASKTNNSNALSELKQQLSLLDNSNKTLKSKLSTAESDSGAQLRKITVLNQSAAELISLQSAYKERNDENAELKKKLAEIDGAYKTLQSQLVTTKTEAGSQARKLTALGQTSTELVALKSAYKTRNDEVQTLKGELTGFSTKLKSLQIAATLKGTQDTNTINALKKKLASFDSSNKTLKTQLATAEAGAGAQARKLTALGQSGAELTALKSAYKARNDETLALKQKLKMLSEEANTCKFEVADLKKNMAVSGNETKSLLGKIATLEKTSSDQARRITALTATSLELDGLRSAYKDLSAKKVELSSKLTAATADADKDGVLDSADKCPFSLEGAEVNAMGCLADADNDGVVDSKDECKSSPVGRHVNEKGCPKIADADGDKVADANDLCPTTAAGVTVNEFGCEPTESITLKGVNFTLGSARLTANSLPILSAAAATLKQNPNLNIEVAGYTDNQGSRRINRSLSQSRANAVMIHLIKEGVEAGKLTAKGYGETTPIASNGTESGRATNRRVELKIR